MERWWLSAKDYNAFNRPGHASVTSASANSRSRHTRAYRRATLLAQTSCGPLKALHRLHRLAHNRLATYPKRRSHVPPGARCPARNRAHHIPVYSPPPLTRSLQYYGDTEAKKYTNK